MQDMKYAMPNRGDKILVWLPSPMGDAVLCTPALRAIREHFESSSICFFARPVVREVLSPSGFNDTWVTCEGGNPFAIAGMLKAHGFSQAILFKNSFASALAVFLAQIPVRIGYSREARGILLTSRLYPARTSVTEFRPGPMIDYYLVIASWLGCDVGDRSLELLVDEEHAKTVEEKFPELSQSQGPIVIMVPGGAFGPSKCWSEERFAATADWLISRYEATVFISVSPSTIEREIAATICAGSGNKLINLGESPLSLGLLKALFSRGDLVITNDTGPRHMAIALKRKVVSLFGPNDPAWTTTGYENEIQVVGEAPCAPCAKPTCKEDEHYCMDAITVEMVCEASQKLLGK